jgi:hypothetical protein
LPQNGKILGDYSSKEIIRIRRAKNALLQCVEPAIPVSQNVPVRQRVENARCIADGRLATAEPPVHLLFGMSTTTIRNLELCAVSLDPGILPLP